MSCTPHRAPPLLSFPATLALSLLAVSCTTGDVPPAPGESPGADAGTGSGGDDGNGQDDPGEELLQLSSTYVMDLRSSVLVDSESGEQQTLETRAGSIVRVVQNDRDVELQVQMCYAVPPEINGAQPTIPDAVVASVEPFTIYGTLEPTASGASLSIEPGGLVLGADLADPLNDALPANASDPRVIDQDGDGNPGITIDYPSPIGTIEIYAAAKFTFTVTSMISDPESFEGTSEAALVTAVYGDNSLLVDVAQLKEDAAATNQVLSEDHRFYMDAVTDDVTCAQVTDG